MSIFDGRQRIRYGYSRYGYTRGNGKTWHGGQDVEALDDYKIRMPDYKGKTISGTVIRSRIITSHLNLTWQWGHYVCVQLDTNQTPDPVRYLYFCHNEKNVVKVGQKVKSGDVLAEMGNSGNAKMANPPFAHCHFEVRKTTIGKGLDPTAYTGIPNAIGVYGKPLIAPYKAKTNAGTLNVRDNAGAEYQKIGTLPAGTNVVIESEVNGFGYIGDGWISLQYIDKI